MKVGGYVLRIGMKKHWQQYENIDDNSCKQRETNKMPNTNLQSLWIGLGLSRYHNINFPTLSFSEQSLLIHSLLKQTPHEEAQDLLTILEQGVDLDSDDVRKILTNTEAIKAIRIAYERNQEQFLKMLRLPNKLPGKENFADFADTERKFRAVMRTKKSSNTTLLSFKEKLEHIWKNVSLQNKSLIGSSISGAQPTNVSELPLTNKTIETILNFKAQELKISRAEITVVVAFHGGNVLEVLMWLEKGVQVIAVDTNSLAGLKLRLKLKKHGYDKLPTNLKITNPFWQKKPKGDIITACHPHISIWSITKPYKRITSYGKNNSIYIIQADMASIFIAPFLDDPNYNKLLYVPHVHRTRYFFPSEFVPRQRGTEIIITTPKNN